MTEHQTRPCLFTCAECNRRCTIKCDGLTEDMTHIYALDKVEYPLNCPCKSLSRRVEGLRFDVKMQV